MPLYDYACGQCDHEFEALQSMNDAPLVICPECTKNTLKKKASAPAFAFKGGGWYKDLYGSAGGAKEKSASPTKESTTATASSESTPAAKPAASPSP